MVGARNRGHWPWYGDLRERMRFEHGVRREFPELRHRIVKRSHNRGIGYRLTIPVESYEYRKVTIRFKRSFPKWPEVSVDGPTTAPHRYDDGTLCTWYIRDPEDQRWTFEDGLVQLLILVTAHLFREAWWREHDEWLGPEVPARSTDPMTDGAELANDPRVTRRRQAFADAYRATVAYAEYPYVVGRRNPKSPVDERARISTELRRIQEDLAFHSAWIRTESRHVARAYEHLVARTRGLAGTLLHEAWLQPGTSHDIDMNIQDVDLSSLEPALDVYLTATRDVLSLWPWWLQVGLRFLTSRVRRFLVGQNSDDHLKDATEHPPVAPDVAGKGR